VKKTEQEELCEFRNKDPFNAGGQSSKKMRSLLDVGLEGPSGLLFHTAVPMGGQLIIQTAIRKLNIEHRTSNLECSMGKDEKAKIRVPCSAKEVCF